MKKRIFFVIGIVLLGLAIFIPWKIHITKASSPVSLYIYPLSPLTPVGGIQSIAVTVNGTTNKNVSWSTTCGTLVGSGDTIGLKSITEQTCTVTATSLADNTVSAQSAVTFEAIRPDLQAEGIHPRIGLTPADVADLQTKTISTNLVWQQGVYSAFTALNSSYNNNFCWSGQSGCTFGPNSAIVSSNGSFTYNQWGSYEDDAATYALMSLIDPATSSRALWASHARDMVIWELTEYCGVAYGQSGPCGTPSLAGMQDPVWALDNRSQHTIVPLAEAIDWAYSAYSATDKALIANVFHIWGQAISSNYTAAETEHPPVGVYDNSSTLYGSGSIEWAFNNYSAGHFQNLVAIGLTLDPADDPNINSCAGNAYTVCPDGSANTVGAYAVSAVKSWLYRIYADAEDAHIVDSAYGLSDPYLCTGMVSSESVPCTGQMSGGMSDEGSEYGPISMAEIFSGIYNLYIAGKLNPTVDPQASFISSAFWDKLAIGYVAMLYPAPVGGGTSWFYQYNPFDDEQNALIIQDQSTLFNAMEVYNTKYGDSWLRNLEKWYQYNVSNYGYPNFFFRFESGYYGNFPFALNSMMSLNSSDDNDFSVGAEQVYDSPIPTPNEYDPRNASTLPLDFEAGGSSGGFYKYFGRTDWTTSATQFQFMCDTPYINHTWGLCGRFDYVRDGEGLIVAIDGYQTMGPENSNEAAYQWNPSYNCAGASIDQQSCLQGGQADNSWAGGTSYLTRSSYNSNYYFGATDASGAYTTNLNYGDYGSPANVTLAQREILWLKPDEIFVYDRGDSAIPGFARFWLDLEAAPTINGNTATMVSPNTGQELFITTLLPANAVLSTSTAPTNVFNQIATSYFESDAGVSTDTRMLNVIEGANSGSVALRTSVVQSSGGTNFDGGTIGAILAMFKRNLTDAFSSVTYPASGATTQYVSDLAPNTTYDIAGSGAPSTATTDTAGVLVFNASGSGTITVSASGVVVDTTPPTTSITSPTSGSTVSSTISVSASASDNVGVTSVSLYVDGSLESTDTNAPYTFSLNTTALSNGSHTLVTKAYDAAGNVGTSANVTITVSNNTPDTTPPSVPTGLTVTSVTSSSIALSWTASTDNVGVTGYNIYRGGVKIGTSGTNAYTNTGLAASTTYSYTVSAYDAAGNTSAQSGSISGTTSGTGGGGDTTPPTTSITSPANNASESGTISITASASDNVGVTSVALYVDGILQSTDTNAPYTFSLNTTNLSNGSHTLSTKAYDAAGNVGTSANVTISVSNTVATPPVTPPPSSSGAGGGGSVVPPPVPSFSITSVSVSGITQTSAQVTVTTHIAASIVVKYGRTTLYGNTTQASPALVTNYVKLAGLSPNTIYDFVVIATPPGGTSVTSEVYTLTTAGGGAASSTVTNPPAFTENLAYGDTSSEVTLLQTILFNQGFLPLKAYITGYFGTQTEHALLLFQNAHDLNKSGFVDLQTESLLNKVAAAETTTSGTTTTQTTTTTTTPSTPASGGTITQNLAPGSTGPEVAILQHLLNTDGVYPAAIYTQYYGSLTEAAVKLFQTREGIVSYGTPATTGYGAVGPKTRGKLNSL